MAIHLGISSFAGVPTRQNTDLEFTTSMESGSGCRLCLSMRFYQRGAFVIVRRNGDITHPIHWSARKLRRVARSSAKA